MSAGNLLQYATLISMFIGGMGVCVAFLTHRTQVKTQIFLALYAQYDELLKSSSSQLWLSSPVESAGPEQREAAVTFAMRFCTLVSLTYLLYCQRRIPKRMWELMLRSAERRFRHPLFLREWAHLATEFESFPEFVELVATYAT